jgi:hypothetical protein
VPELAVGRGVIIRHRHDDKWREAVSAAIVIPALNEVDTIGPLLDDCLAQDLPPRR